MRMTAQDVIDRLGLEVHPEGGCFRECYRSACQVLHPGLVAGNPRRSAATGIYFLLAEGDFSAFHRVRASDEIWHFYAGDPVELYLLRESGVETRHLSGELTRGEPMAVAPADTWQAARVVAGGAWALCGCTVAPGFDFADFEMARRGDLLARFPDHAELITSLTR